MKMAELVQAPQCRHTVKACHNVVHVLGKFRCIMDHELDCIFKESIKKKKKEVF